MKGGGEKVQIFRQLFIGLQLTFSTCDLLVTPKFIIFLTTPWQLPLFARQVLKVRSGVRAGTVTCLRRSICSYGNIYNRTSHGGTTKTCVKLFNVMTLVIFLLEPTGVCLYLAPRWGPRTIDNRRLN